MSYTQRFSEGAALLATIPPASYSAEQNTGYVSLENYARAVVILHCGVIGGNLDVDMEQATDTNGTSAKALDSGNKDTTKTASTDNDTVTVIEIRSEELDVDNSFDCINVEVTPAAAGIFSVEVWGLEPRYSPVDTDNLDEVVD